jgi:hypothetical protein
MVRTKSEEEKERNRKKGDYFWIQKGEERRSE